MTRKNCVWFASDSVMICTKREASSCPVFYNRTDAPFLTLPSGWLDATLGDDFPDYKKG